MKYLDRSLVQSTYHYALCLSEREFYRELKRLHVPQPWPSFVNKDAHATVHFIDSPKLASVAVVCIDPSNVLPDPIVLAGLLVHESVHIFQHICADIGESDPSKEFEAYSIQWISQQLMWAYVASLPKP